MHTDRKIQNIAVQRQIGGRSASERDPAAPRVLKSSAKQSHLVANWLRLEGKHQADQASRSAAATERASESARIPSIARRIGSRRAPASACFNSGMAVGTTLRESTPSAISPQAT